MNKVILSSLFLGRDSQHGNTSNASDVKILEYFPFLVPDESLDYHSVPNILVAPVLVTKPYCGGGRGAGNGKKSTHWEEAGLIFTLNYYPHFKRKFTLK